MKRDTMTPDERWGHLPPEQRKRREEASNKAREKNAKKRARAARKAAKAEGGLPDYWSGYWR